MKGRGFTFVGTQGTPGFYKANVITCEVVNKIDARCPDVVDMIMNKEVCLVINTPKAKRNYAVDRKTMRKMCLKYKVSYITTIAGVLAAVNSIEAVKNGNGGEDGVKSLQEYHSLIKQFCDNVINSLKDCRETGSFFTIVKGLAKNLKKNKNIFQINPIIYMRR